MFLTHGSVEIDIITTRGEFEGKRPDDFVVVNIAGIAKDAPEVGELETGELAGDEMVGFGVAEEGGRGRIVAEDAVEALEVGSEDMICLDEDAVFAGANDGIGLRGVFNNGDISLCVGDKVVFRDRGGEFREGIEGLTGGFTFLGDVANDMGRFQAIIPFVDVGVGEADVEAVFIDGVFKIWLTSVFAGVVAPDTLVREGKIAVRARDSKGVTLEKFARGRKPIIIAADETFVVFANGEDSAAVLVRVGFAALLVNGTSDFFVKQEIRLEMKSFGSGENFVDDFGIILFVDFLLDTKGIHVGGSEEIMAIRAKALGEKTTVISMGTTKLKHKFIIA